jgi:hypothetical protein
VLWAWFLCSFCPECFLSVSFIAPSFSRKLWNNELVDIIAKDELSFFTTEVEEFKGESRECKMTIVSNILWTRAMFVVCT